MPSPGWSDKDLASNWLNQKFLERKSCPFLRELPLIQKFKECHHRTIPNRHLLPKETWDFQFVVWASSIVVGRCYGSQGSYRDKPWTPKKALQFIKPKDQVQRSRRSLHIFSSRNPHPHWRVKWPQRNARCTRKGTLSSHLSPTKDQSNSRTLLEASLFPPTQNKKKFLIYSRYPFPT